MRQAVYMRDANSWDWSETFSSRPRSSSKMDFKAIYGTFRPIVFGAWGSQGGIVPGDLVQANRLLYTYYITEDCPEIRRGDQLVLVKFICVPKKNLVTYFLIECKTGKAFRYSIPLNGKHQDYASLKEILSSLHWLFSKVKV